MYFVVNRAGIVQTIPMMPRGWKYYETFDFGKVEEAGAAAMKCCRVSMKGRFSTLRVLDADAS